MLETIFLIVATILFVLAALDVAGPYQPRLVPLGLAFLSAALWIPLLP